jgi:phosphoribosyl 1,2-cyclic phosphodiesterase
LARSRQAGTARAVDVVGAIKTQAFERALSANLRILEKPSTGRSRITEPRVICLGESHGSHFLTLKRSFLPGTGGLLLKVPQTLGPDILIDPGWGTLGAALRAGVSLDCVGTVIVSHCHLDHVGDLPALLLYLNLKKRRPALYVNRTTLLGGPRQPPVLSDYFKSLCDRIVMLEGRALHAIDRIELETFPSRHRENAYITGQSLAFILTLRTPEVRRLAILTDGPFSDDDEDFVRRIASSDSLLVNIGTASADRTLPGHDRTFDNALCLEGLESLFRALSHHKCSLRRIAVTHLGAELLVAGSPPMRRWLLKSGHAHPLAALRKAISVLARRYLAPRVTTRILQEGHSLAISP